MNGPKGRRRCPGYDLGAPFLSGLYNLTRRGEHCSPAARPEPAQGTAAARPEPVQGTAAARPEPAQGTAAARPEPAQGTAAARPEPVQGTARHPFNHSAGAQCAPLRLRLCRWFIDGVPPTGYIVHFYKNCRCILSLFPYSAPKKFVILEAG